MMRLRLWIASAAWIVGIAAALGGRNAESWLWPGACALIVAAGWYYRRIRAGEAALAALALAAAMGWGTLAEAGNVTRIDVGSGETVRLAGIIDSAVDVDGDRAIFTLRTDLVAPADGEAMRVRERVRITVRLLEQSEQEAAMRWRRGQRIAMDAALTRPEEAGNWGAFDYRAYLYRQRIHWTGEAKGIDGIEVEEGSRRTAAWWFGRIDQARAALSGRIDALFPDAQPGLMKSLLIGDRTDLPARTERLFTHAGLAHILAVSGSNVGIFVGVVLFVLRWSRISRETSLIVCTALIPLFMLLTGAEPPVVRAGLMAMAGLELARRNRLKDGLDLLGLSAVIMTAWDPYLALNIGFQLSFLITLGLIVGVPYVYGFLPIRRRPLRAAVAVTFVAQIVSFPLTIHYFNSFSWLSLPANLLLAPALGMLSFPLGLCALALSWMPVSWPAQAAAWLAARVNEAVLWLLERWMRWDPYGTVWPSPPVWWIVLYYVLTALLLRSLSRAVRYVGPPMTERALALRRAGWRRAAAGTAAALAALVWYAYAPDRWDRTGTVAFLDVGQGDAILISTPERRHILVDTGGTVRFRKPGDEWKERRSPYDTGEDLLVPLLKKRGIGRIDYLIVTHADADHIGGARAVLEHLRVDRLIFNGTLKTDGVAEQVFRAALERDVRLYAAESGRSVRIGRGTTLTFLHPEGERPVGANGTHGQNGVTTGGYAGGGRLPVVEDQNDLSVVVLLDMLGTRVLMSGDIGAGTEEAIVRRQLQAAASSGGIAADASDAGNERAFSASAEAVAGFGRVPIAAAGAASRAGSPAEKTAGVESGPIDPDIDVLKVSHHGSRHSSADAWLDYWKPEHAVVSAGKNNFYGHPHPSVLDKLERRGIRVWRTDLDGEIRLQIRHDGYRLIGKKSASEP